MTDQTPEATVKPSAKPRKRTSRKGRTFPMSASALAQDLARTLNRPVTAKTVRQWARDNLAAYQDERYTPHAYDAATVKAIEAGFVKRTARSQAASKAGQ